MRYEAGIAQTIASVGQKTNVRWLILAMLFITTTLNYADRATIVIVGPVISKDLGLNSAEMGIIFSTFGWACVSDHVPLPDFATGRESFFALTLSYTLRFAAGRVA